MNTVNKTRAAVCCVKDNFCVGVMSFTILLQMGAFSPKKNCLASGPQKVNPALRMSEDTFPVVIERLKKIPPVCQHTDVAQIVQGSAPV